MTAREFSDLFDVLYNNITSNLAPGLNEYEKSVFLTKAQYELVKNYFLPQSNAKQAGFDDNPKRQLDFSRLIDTYTTEINKLFRGNVDPRSFTVSLCDGILYIINESIQYKTPSASTGVLPTLEAIRQVIPISYEKYTQLMSKPFKEPLKNQSWRIITDVASGTPKIELILTTADVKKYVNDSSKVTHYVCRYVKKPIPIILTDLTGTGEDISIDGYKGNTSEGYINGVCCELDPAIHEEILQRAVELAKIAWAGNQEELASALMHVTSGQRSE